jgi:predicted DNA-binding transcriptional regulator YafY
MTKRGKADGPGRAESQRRLRQAGRLGRVLKVLELIQGRGRYAVKDVAAELECSERTVFRDLAVLQMAGVPYYHDREAQCLRVRPGFRFPTVDLTDHEFIGQATADALTTAPGLDVSAGSRPTTRKLLAASETATASLLREVQRVTSVLDLKLADHGRHHELIRTAQWALIRSTQLLGDYASPYETAPRRIRLHPYRLCLLKQAWYLIGREEGKERPQTYRMARWKSLRQVDEPANIPDDFDLRAYFGNAWAAFRGETTHDVELRFSPSAAAIVRETVWHPTQAVSPQEDGGVILTFRVDGLEEIVHWVLGWTGRVTVVRPDELRRRVVDQLQEALALNQLSAHPAPPE